MVKIDTKSKGDRAFEAEATGATNVTVKTRTTGASSANVETGRTSETVETGPTGATNATVETCAAGTIVETDATSATFTTSATADTSATLEASVASATTQTAATSTTIANAESSATGAVAETGATARLNQLLSSLRERNQYLDLTGMLPPDLEFKTYGGCSDVWFGHLVDGTPVAVKRARVSGDRDSQEK